MAIPLLSVVLLYGDQRVHSGHIIKRVLVVFAGALHHPLEILTNTGIFRLIRPEPVDDRQKGVWPLASTHL